MLVLLAAGLGLWIAYGVMNNSPPIILAKAAGLMLVVALIVMKIVFDPAPTRD